MPEKRLDADSAIGLFKSIHDNPELIEWELRGFFRGMQKGKTMNVSIETLQGSLVKQWKDYLKAYATGDESGIKRTLADLRSVAGCVFLKMQKMERKKT